LLSATVASGITCTLKPVISTTVRLVADFFNIDVEN